MVVSTSNHKGTLKILKRIRKSMPKHYKRNKPKSGGYVPSHNLGTKWGNIPKDVVVFFGCYNAVVALNILGTSKDMILQNYLDLFLKKEKDKTSFVYKHCWLFLRSYHVLATIILILVVATTTMQKMEGVTSFLSSKLRYTNRVD